MNGEGTLFPLFDPLAPVLSFALSGSISSCRPFLRWMHASCESLFTEDDVEHAADEGFDCVSCQPYVVKPAGEYQLLGERRGQG